MTNFYELKVLFIQDLKDLKRYGAYWGASAIAMMESAKRGLPLKSYRMYWASSAQAKEQKIGQRCYVAEEALTEQELAQLKRQLDISESEWQRYKTMFIATSSERFA